MGEQLRVAVIGSGDMGGRHVQGWQQSGHEVRAVADADQSRATQLADNYGVPTVHNDYRETLALQEIDAVSVCLPLALHAPVTIDAANAGKHVFCEKPLAPSLADADAMENAVTKAGVHFGVGFQRNLGEGVGVLRDLAADGRFGHPMIINCDMLMEVRPKIAMHDRNGNNGPFTDAGCHYYLLWQTVFRARPKTVYAQGHINAIGRPEVAGLDQLAIDTGVITVTYESGDIGTITASWGLAKGFSLRGNETRLVGPKGGAQGNTLTELTVYEGAESKQLSFANRDLWQVELGLFADAILGGAPYPYGFATGRQMIAVTDGIMRSIATGQPVALS